VVEGENRNDDAFSKPLMTSEQKLLPVNYERTLRARHGLMSFDFAELWRYHELFLLLAWRDILIRYKQTYLGVAWAVLQPALTTVVFVALNRMTNFSTHGAAAPVFIFAPLLLWQLFANALTESSNSLAASARIISKVYFPRLIIPASAVLSGTLDFLIGLGILGVLMLGFGVPFRMQMLLLPGFFALCFITAFAAGVWLSALNVKYRDVRYIVPFFTRIGLYISPIWFLSEDFVPAKWLLLYHTLNPMAGVMEGFRWCVLGVGFEPYWPGIFAGQAVTLVTLVTGLIYFRQAEKTFADIV
jgi:lipopolysaccharide transport system permease protein